MRKSDKNCNSFLFAMRKVKGQIIFHTCFNDAC